MALAADPNRRSLYVWSEGKAQTKGLGKDGQGRSEVLEFDLDSARLRRRLSPAVAGGGAGDLTVGPDGSLFVADPRTGRVDMLRPGKDALEVLVEAGPLLSPQGMAVSSDRRVLFVADYAQGVARVDLETREVAFLPAPESVLVTGIDGLVRAGDSLVAIQNGLPPHRVARLRMDPAGTRIMSGEILERASPHFDEPTLGVLVGSDLYYVANSQYEAFDKDGRPDEARLKNPVILKLRLQWVEGR
jgi:streptogramin lyase